VSFAIFVKNLLKAVSTFCIDETLVATFFAATRLVIVLLVVVFFAISTKFHFNPRN